MCETDESERYLGDLDDQLFALHQLLEAMSDGIALLDEHGVIRDVKGCLLELTGFVGDDLMGQDVSLLVLSRDRATFQRYRDDYLPELGAREIGSDEDLTLRCHDGSEVSVDIFLSPLALGDQCGPSSLS